MPDLDSTISSSVENTALAVESANFETRKVQNLDANTLRIRPTVGSLAFSLLFVILGCALIVFWGLSTFTSFEGPGSVPLMLMGILFAAAGLWTYRSGNEQLVINNDTGVSFLRSWHPVIPLNTKSLVMHIQPQDIVSIQTVSRVVKHRSNRSRRSSSYTEYQVNFCTSGNERKNALVTLKLEKAEALGTQLAQLFGVPLKSH